MQVKIIQNNSALNRSANSFRFRLILEPALSLCLGCLVVQLRFSESLFICRQFGEVASRSCHHKGFPNPRQRKWPVRPPMPVEKQPDCPGPEGD